MFCERAFESIRECSVNRCVRVLFRCSSSLGNVFVFNNISFAGNVHERWIRPNENHSNWIYIEKNWNALEKYTISQRTRTTTASQIPFLSAVLIVYECKLKNFNSDDAIRTSQRLHNHRQCFQCSIASKNMNKREKVLIQRFIVRKQLTKISNETAEYSYLCWAKKVSVPSQFVIYSLFIYSSWGSRLELRELIDLKKSAKSIRFTLPCWCHH